MFRRTATTRRVCQCSGQPEKVASVSVTNRCPGRFSFSLGIRSHGLLLCRRSRRAISSQEARIRPSPGFRDPKGEPRFVPAQPPEPAESRHQPVCRRPTPSLLPINCPVSRGRRRAIFAACLSAYSFPIGGLMKRNADSSKRKRMYAFPGGRILRRFFKTPALPGPRTETVAEFPQVDDVGRKPGDGCPNTGATT